MPSKAAKAAAHLKTHNRTASASSTGKVATAFNRTKSVERIKRNASDLQQHLRNGFQYPHIPRQHSPTKKGVVLAAETSPGAGTDDDEWVSSESGAATPAEQEESAPPTPREPKAVLHPPPPPVVVVPNPDVEQVRSQPPQVQVQRPTPTQSQPQSQTQIQQDSQSAATPRAEPAPLPSESQPQPPKPHPQRQRPQSLVEIPRTDPSSSKFTTHPSSRTPSPDPEPRRSMTRPPSTRSIHSIRPHPLIRTRSYAPSTPVSAAPPAFSPTTASPLSSPISHVHNKQSSPDSTIHSHYFPSLRRRGSRSSIASVATLPLPARSTATGTTTSTSHVHGERQRTLSQASSSTSAALSSLAAAAQPHAHHGGLTSRPSSPVLPTAFPPPNVRFEHDLPLLPSVLASSHATTMAHHKPMWEALRRVAHVKAGR